LTVRFRGEVIRKHLFQTIAMTAVHHDRSGKRRRNRKGVGRKGQLVSFQTKLQPLRQADRGNSLAFTSPPKGSPRSAAPHLPYPGRAVPGLEEVAVEVGDPLLAFRRQLQIADRVVDIGFDLQREEIGKDRPKIGGGPAAELFHRPDLRELGIQRRQLAMVEGIGELADQVRGPNRPARCW
jgi:hypothetical protein